MQELVEEPDLPALLRLLNLLLREPLPLPVQLLLPLRDALPLLLARDGGFAELLRHALHPALDLRAELGEPLLDAGVPVGQHVAVLPVLLQQRLRLLGGRAAIGRELAHQAPQRAVPTARRVEPRGALAHALARRAQLLAHPALVLRQRARAPLGLLFVPGVARLLQHAV